MKDPSWEIRDSTATGLGAIGPAAVEAVPALIIALGDEEVYVRATAASALGNIGPVAKDSIPALLGRLGDYVQGAPDGEAVGLNAAYALSRIGPEALPGVIEALKQDDWKVRLCAAHSLGMFRPAPNNAVSALITALHDDHELVRYCAVVSLGEVGSAAREAIPLLLEMLKDKREEVRKMIRFALEAIRAKD